MGILHREKFQNGDSWTWTERLTGSQTCFTHERFLPESEWRDEEIIRCFGSSTPSSDQVLLHYYKAHDCDAKSAPILLVHGAGHYARKSWGSEDQGLLRTLCRTGRSIFALTFAHPHGDNFQQAVQLYNAIQRIKEITQKEKVDLIAHSKGGIVALTYLANWGSCCQAAYNQDVARCFLLGTPNKGLDYPFRHVLPNWLVKGLRASAPLACDSMLFFGRYIDTTLHSIYKEGGAFLGSSQLLYRWDERYPVQAGAQTIYKGGQHLFYHSRGIDAAIQDGGDYIDRLLKTPIHPDIEVHILAGNSPYIHGFCTEWDGESDGLVFVDSALHTGGLVREEEQITRKNVLPLNHLQLLYHPLAHQWVLEGLH